MGGISEYEDIMYYHTALYYGVGAFLKDAYPENCTRL